LLEPVMPIRRPRFARGFTLVELLVVVAVAVILLAIGIPSFRTFIVEQRLQSLTAQVATDLQFARAEAAARNLPVYISYRQSTGNQTCYAIYTSTVGYHCNCTFGALAACPLASQTLIKIVSVPWNESVRLRAPVLNMAFDNVTGGTVWGTTDFTDPNPSDWNIEASVIDDTTRTLRVNVSPGGRTSICNVGSKSVGGFPACA
jgi:type IV fimbrial biogenesis protein FimT